MHILHVGIVHTDVSGAEDGNVIRNLGALEAAIGDITCGIGASLRHTTDATLYEGYGLGVAIVQLAAEAV